MNDDTKDERTNELGAAQSAVGCRAGGTADELALALAWLRGCVTSTHSADHAEYVVRHVPVGIAWVAWRSCAWGEA